ncbi:MAG: hypothetical protein HY704_13190, partial [Gemmatimonadetes bacterium]|nr:hypothetical protein [Gemmatimonadota bacterium]
MGIRPLRGGWRRLRAPGTRLLCSAAPWIALLALVLWVRSPAPGWLLIGAATAIACVLAGSVRERWRAFAAVALIAGTAAGFAGHFQLMRLGESWAALRAEREAEVSGELRRRLDALLDRGEGAVGEAAAGARADARADTTVFSHLERMRRRWDMSAVALYDASGRLRGWAGDHRGAVPPSVQRGEKPYVFAERPLFSYLYFTAPLPERAGTAVAAALMRVSVVGPRARVTGGFAAEIEAETGERLLISRAERAVGAAVWDLRYRDETLLSVSLAEPSLSARQAALDTRWRRIVAGLATIALVLASVGCRSSPLAWASLPPVALLTASAILPLDRLLGLQRLFSPALFLLPGPVGLTLGRLLAVLAAAWFLVGWLGVRVGLRARLPGVVLVAVGFPLGLRALAGAASLELLAGPTPQWLAYQAAGVLLLALVAVPALVPERGGRDGRHRRVLLGAGLVLTVLFCVLVAFLLEGRSLPFGLAAAWALPAWLVGTALAGRRGWLG